jgi:uncharacterized sodium:solute symporter family permease YidK
VFVRFLALRSEKEVSKGAAVAIVWTVLATSGAVLIGMIGRHLLMSPGEDATEVLGSGGQNVLPLLVDKTLPILLIGIYNAVVLLATKTATSARIARRPAACWR